MKKKHNLGNEAVYYARTLGPVSYTHLDVYKRQLQSCFCNNAIHRCYLPSL